MNRRKLESTLREEALGGGGKVSLAALLEVLVPVKKLRRLARTHGLSPKGGFRLEKAKAEVLVPLLTDPEAPKVLEETCALLAEHMTRGIGRAQEKGAVAAVAAGTVEGRTEAGAEPGAADASGTPSDLMPLLELKDQELAKARAELEKSRKTAERHREKVAEMSRRREQDKKRLAQADKTAAGLRDTVSDLQSRRPAVPRDQASRIQALEKELDEQNQIELQQRIKLAEQAAMIRDREERIAELEELVPRGRRRKRHKEPPPPPERFVVPHFTPSFLKSLANKDRRSVEHAYRAVFLYCTEGSRYPGLQVKALDPNKVWSLRASRRLRVYFLPRHDGDVDILELIDRQEQETALRRYREKP